MIANIRSAIQRWHEGHTLHQGILESAQGIYREIMDHVRGSPVGSSNTGSRCRWNGWPGGLVGLVGLLWTLGLLELLGMFARIARMMLLLLLLLLLLLCFFFFSGGGGFSLLVDFLDFLGLFLLVVVIMFSTCSYLAYTHSIKYIFNPFDTAAGAGSQRIVITGHSLGGAIAAVARQSCFC